MTAPAALVEKAFGNGQYYLIDVETVVSLYRDAGYDVDNEDEEVPNVLTIDGHECFFTGDLVKRDQVYYEIIIVANGFSWDEVESDADFDDEE
ncbi:MAG: hypothetical protein RIR26_1453 [Pseudomonadota bacterium]|jgi:hypothetical protein